MTRRREHSWYTLRCLRNRICHHCQHVDLRKSPASQRITRQPCKSAP